MSENSKRRFKQFHLSTAIVLLIETAVFIWLNTLPHEEPIWSLDYGDKIEFVLESAKEQSPSYGLDFEKTENSIRSYGWPLKCVQFGNITEPNGPAEPNYTTGTVDFGAFILVSVFIALGCEYFNCRRKQRNA